MYKRAMICIPDIITKRITKAENWLNILTLKNSYETVLDYTILIPDGEIADESEHGITFRDYHQTFHGFEIYSDFKENISKLLITTGFRTIEKKIGDVGFAVYGVIDKTTKLKSGYALLYFYQTQDSKNLIEAKFETHVDTESFNKIWGELNPHHIDLSKFIKHIFPELQSETDVKNLILHVLAQYLNNPEFQKLWSLSKYKGNHNIYFKFFRQNITITIEPKLKEIINVAILGPSLFGNGLVINQEDVKKQINFQSLFNFLEIVDTN